MREFIIFILTLLIVLPSYGLSLTQALQTAQENNPQLLAAQARLKAAKSLAVQQSWLSQPELMLEYQQIPQGSFNPDRAQMSMYGVSQKLPFPYKLWLEHSAAWNTEQRYKYLYDQAFLDLRADVVEAYYRLFLANKKFEINQKNLDVLKRFQQAAESKYVVGRASQSDLLTAQIQFELISNDHKTLAQEAELARTQLQKLLNKPVVSGAEDTPRLLKLKLTLAEANEQALLANPMLLALRAEKNHQTDKHLLSKISLIPDLKTAFLQRQVPDRGLNGWDLKISAEIPLWFWSKAAAINEAGYEQDAAEDMYLDFQNELTQKVETAYIKFDAAQRSGQLYQEIILNKAKQALAAAETAYQADKIDFLTLLNVQKMNFDAELIYYQHLADLETYKAKLEALIGGEII